MTDHYDAMRVPPDPSLAEALRQRLHAHMASVSRDDHEVDLISNSTPLVSNANNTSFQ